MRTFAVIVRNDSSFVDIMKALIHYAGEFETHYDVKLVDARHMNIVEDIMSTRYLLASTSASYIL